ncbi:MAG: ABC transporter substrate-binding protein [Patescibacteria group bacterium]
MTFFDRLKRAWQQVFFWQKNDPASAEIAPQVHDDHALVLAVTNAKSSHGIKQIRFINRVLTGQEKRVFWIAVILVLVSGGLLASEIVRTNMTASPAVGGTYVEALVGSPKLINPLFAPANDVDRDLSSLIFSGLFRVGPDLSPLPDLAESYQWLDNGKTLQVAIRKDARFHDGEPVDADDVIFTVAAAKNPSWRSPVGAILKDVQTVRVDDYTVQFQLPEARPSFLLDLTFGILPEHLWNDIQDTNAQLADLNTRPIGSGPYRVTAFTRDGKGAILHYDLERFDAYYGIKPNIQHLRFRFYPDRKTAADALKQQQVNGLAFLPWGDAKSLIAGAVLTVQVQLPQETVVFFNTKDNLLKEPKLREALMKAIQPTDIQGLLQAPSALVNGPYPFIENTSSTQKPDLEAARKALDELGWKLQEGASVRTMKGSGASSTPTELDIHVRVPEQPDLIKVAEALQRFWSLAGAKVEIETGDADQLLRETVANRNHQIYITNILLSPNQDMKPFWSSAAAAGTGLNFSNLADRDVDAALAAIDQATSTEAIASARQTFMNKVQSKFAAYFLLRPSYAYAISTDVKGVTNEGISRPSDRFQSIQEWYINTHWTWKSE